MASFWHQFLSLMYLNLLLKSRNIKQLLQEILVPILFIVAVRFLYGITRVENFPAIGYDRYISYSLLQDSSINTNWERIAYTPNKTETYTVMRNFTEALGDNFRADGSGLLAYDTEKEMLTAFNVSRWPRAFDMGIVFSTKFPDNLTVTIRMDPNTPWDYPTDLYTDDQEDECRKRDRQDDDYYHYEDIKEEPGKIHCSGNLYFMNGFAKLQVILQNAMASVAANKTLPMPDFRVRMMPKARLIQLKPDVMRTVAAILYIVTYAVFIGVLLSNLVYDKEKKIKESMLMMGMSNSTYWLAWFVLYGGIMILVSIVMAVLSKFALDTVPNGNILLLFLIFFLYGMSMISLSFVLTPFFNKAVMAERIATLATLVMGLIYFPVGFFSADIAIVFKWLLSFISPLALGLAMDQAMVLELDDSGLQFDNCGLGGFPPYVAMLAVDAVLYLLLAIYFDNVIPGTYGQPKSPWFCFMPSFWCKTHGKTNLIDDLDGIELTAQDDMERVSPEMRAKIGISIRNLTKTYPGSWGTPGVFAVRGISLDIYEGQITCLLGHNGAGKTTLLNALTGLVPADSGYATICGYSIRDPIQMQKIRSMMGVCSQDNTLFDKLTPREHLTVYAGLKGVPRKDIKAEVDKILKLTMLDQSENVRSQNLSGGQKRKLCVGIALIGNPKILFLDEPSSGMDPYSRRQMWNLLKSQRQGRIMVLTTHFMDEADILADQKAVVSRGSLRCYGTSLFLKNRFGVGYHLGMVVDQNANVREITRLVRSYIPKGQVSRSHGMELAYTLPLQDVKRFPDFFQALEARSNDSKTSIAKQLGIQSYGVSMTTLEEVFLKLNEEEEADERDLEASAKESSDNIGSVHGNNQVDPASMDISSLITTPLRPGHNQIIALCKVQFYQMFRDPKTYIFRVLVPVLFIVVAAILIATVSFAPTPGGEIERFVFDPNVYLKNTLDSTSQGLTDLLYQNNLTEGDLAQLVKQFDSMKLISEEIDELSGIMSKAPHSMAVVAEELNIAAGEMPVLLAVYNDSAQQSLPIILNILSNAIVSLQTSGNRDYDVTIVNHPWPAEKYKGNSLNSGIIMVFCLALAMVILPGAFTTNIVKERQEGIRTQLRVSGVSTLNYWLSHFIVDAGQLYFIVLLAFICSLASGLSIDGTSLTQEGAIFTYLMFMLFYVPLEVIYAYCLGFLFKDYKTCQSYGQFFFILVPILLLAATVASSLSEPSSPQQQSNYGPTSLYGPITPSPESTFDLEKLLHLGFTFLYAPYAKFGILYYLETIYEQYSSSEKLAGLLTFDLYLDFDQLFMPTILCVVGALIVVTALLPMLEIWTNGGSVLKAIIKRSKKDDSLNETNFDKFEDEDGDVKKEREKVQSLLSQEVLESKCVVAASGIRKVFTRRNGCCNCCGCRPSKIEKKAAVRNLSLSVKEGEVLGLLGPNGAGKTTSMNIITAEMSADCGKIRIAGHDIRSSQSKAFLAMGYCPQHDPLYENVTMREHLEVYALIKGIHRRDAKHVAQHFMEALKVTEHADKKASKLSGGTKRKLCFAISMLGQPKIVFFDEPSTGMDPSSKRFVWNTIISSFRGNRGAVLTTHSMEEADAVCSRVGIMVSGKLMCLGTTQHLKGKYGSGYSLEVKLNPGPAYYTMDHTSDQATQLLEKLLSMLDHQIKKVVPRAVVVENFGERVTYSVPNTDVMSLSSIFATLEQGKDNLHIEEYSFSQATLEQVFLEFAKMQPDEGQEAIHHLARQNSAYFGATNGGFQNNEQV